MNVVRRLPVTLYSCAISNPWRCITSQEFLEQTGEDRIIVDARDLDAGGGAIDREEHIRVGFPVTSSTSHHSCENGALKSLHTAAARCPGSVRTTHCRSRTESIVNHSLIRRFAVTFVRDLLIALTRVCLHQRKTWTAHSQYYRTNQEPISLPLWCRAQVFRRHVGCRSAGILSFVWERAASAAVTAERITRVLSDDGAPSHVMIP